MKPKTLLLALMLVLMSASAFAVSTLNTNIVSYYKLDVNSTTQKDELNRNNGTMSLAKFSNNGKIYGGYNYTSGANKMTVPASTSMNKLLQSDFAFNVWMKHICTTYCDIISRGSLASNRFIYIERLSGNNTFQIVFKNGATQYSFYTKKVIPSNTQTMLTVMRSGNNLSAYINASYVGSVTVSGNASLWGANLYLGVSTDGTSYPYRGVADEFGVWNRSLTASERLELYNNYTGKQYPFANTPINKSLSAKKYWDNSSISTFNATIRYKVLSNSSLYNKNVGTTSSTVFSGFAYNSTGCYRFNSGSSYMKVYCLVNITYYKTGTYFNKSYTNINISSDHTGYLKQSQVKFFGRNTITNASYTNFTIKLNGTTACTTTTTQNNCTAYPNFGTWRAELRPNHAGDFHASNTTITISALDNRTIYLYAHEHNVTVRVKYISTNATINTFTVNLSDTESSDKRQNHTTNGKAVFGVIHHLYNFTLVSVPGYAVSSPDGTFNGSRLVNISGDYNLTYYVYKYNSVNFSFFDVDNPSVLLTSVNVSLSLISSTSTSNYSNSSGYIFVDNLTADDWEARYSAIGYNQNNYFFTVTSSSTQRISLYLQNSTVTTLFKIILRDQNDDLVPGKKIRLQSQIPALGVGFFTIRECETNEEGVCYMYIVEGIGTYYRFIIVDTDGGIIKTTDPSPIVTLSTEEKVITLRVDTGSNLVDPLRRVLGVFGEVNIYSSNISNFTFIDGYNAITGGCLRVSRRNLFESNFTEVNESCSLGTSGVISINFTSALINDSVILFEGLVNYTDSYSVVDSKEKVFRKALSNVDEDDNLFFTACLFLIVSFGMVWFPNYYIQLLVNFGCVLGMVLLGYTLLGVPLVMGFLALGLYITWDRRTARGYS